MVDEKNMVHNKVYYYGGVKNNKLASASRLLVPGMD